jgi:uncharacterized protein YndB with AHSA1/START domain
MSVNARTIHATPEKVWEVLSDGWLYPLWVVGATRMRDVEATWPQVGAKIHHSVGVWPAVVDDNTEVLESEPGRLLQLRARGWPMGEAQVTITLTPAGADTRVEIAEEAVSGPAAMVPKPAMDLMIKVRNVESLRRLAFVAERRATD